MTRQQTNKTLRIFCGSDISSADRNQLIIIAKHVNSDLRIIFNQSGDCDLALVLNFDPKFHWVRCPEGQFIKWLTEPVVEQGLSRRFSRVHSSKFDRVFTSNPALPNEVEGPPFYPPRISEEKLQRTYDSPTTSPKKSRIASMIASSLTDLPGHKFRHAVIQALSEQADVDLEVFGRGINPIAKKEDALMPFMFSVVIENSFTGSYWSEKVSDAFLCSTVPIYAGTRRLAEYFPKDSFIDVNDLSPHEIIVALRKLDKQEYLRRLHAVQKAKELCLFEQNLIGAVGQLMEASSTSVKSRVHITLDSNSLTHWILKVFAPVLRLGAKYFRALKPQT